VKWNRKPYSYQLYLHFWDVKRRMSAPRELQRQDPVKKFQSDDDELLECQPFLRAYVRRMRSCRDSHDDIVQETFARALAHKAKSLKKPENRLAWLRATARNVAREQRRTALRLCVADLFSSDGVTAPSTTLPDWDLQYKEAQQTLITAMTAIRKDYMDILQAHFLDGASAPQLAEARGKSIDAVRSLIRRGLRALRQQLPRALDGSLVRAGGQLSACRDDI
jgi:RNA polymerase sigma factor (sigma-70 family)